MDRWYQPPSPPVPPCGPGLRRSVERGAAAGRGFPTCGRRRGAGSWGWVGVTRRSRLTSMQRIAVGRGRRGLLNCRHPTWALETRRAAFWRAAEVHGFAVTRLCADLGTRRVDLSPPLERWRAAAVPREGGPGGTTWRPHYRWGRHSSAWPRGTSGNPRRLAPVDCLDTTELAKS